MRPKTPPKSIMPKNQPLRCEFCDDEINPLKMDDQTWKEFKLSGLCVRCQEDVFNKSSVPSDSDNYFVESAHSDR